MVYTGSQSPLVGLASITHILWGDAVPSKSYFPTPLVVFSPPSK